MLFDVDEAEFKIKNNVPHPSTMVSGKRVGARFIVKKMVPKDNRDINARFKPVGETDGSKKIANKEMVNDRLLVGDIPCSNKLERLVGVLEVKTKAPLPGFQCLGSVEGKIIAVIGSRFEIDDIETGLKSRLRGKGEKTTKGK